MADNVPALRDRRELSFEESEERMLQLGNARMATIIRRRMLHGFVRLMVQDPMYAPPLAPEMLKLLKDSEDRGFGAPLQRVSSTSVSVTHLDVGKLSTSALEEVLAAVDEAEILDAESEEVHMVNSLDVVDGKTRKGIDDVLDAEELLDLRDVE